MLSASIAKTTLSRMISWLPFPKMVSFQAAAKRAVRIPNTATMTNVRTYVVKRRRTVPQGPSRSRLVQDPILAVPPV